MTKVWVITREINMYDQDGAYFEKVFISKPTLDQLEDFFCQWKPEVRRAKAEHLLAGGGRIGYEDTWYYLNEEDAE